MAQLQPASKSASPPLRSDSVPSLGDIFPGSAECEPLAATTQFTRSPIPPLLQQSSRDTPNLLVPKTAPRAPRTSRRAKAHVTKACQNCKRAHLSCNEARPCVRCVYAGKESTCIDVEHKKRGRPRLRDDTKDEPDATVPFLQTHEHKGIPRYFHNISAGPAKYPLGVRNDLVPRPSPHSSGLPSFLGHDLPPPWPSIWAPLGNFSKDVGRTPTGNSIENTSPQILLSEGQIPAATAAEQSVRGLGRQERNRTEPPTSSPNESPGTRNEIYESSNYSATEDMKSEITDYSKRSVDQDESGGSPDTTILLSTFVDYHQAIHRNVLAELYSLFERGGNQGIVSHAPSQSTGSAASQNMDRASGVSSSTSSNGPGKRRLNDSNTNLPDDDDYGDQGRKRRRRAAPAPGKVSICPHFACPFFKRKPEKHRKWRSCAGPGWKSVHRVKEHIYRRHALPITCPRCSTIFEDENDLKQHSKALIPCEPADSEDLDGFNNEQEKQMRSRKRPPGQTEAERWIETYRILFPLDHESMIPSPFYDDELTIVKRRIQQTLPKKLHRELRQHMPTGSESVQDALLFRFEEIVRDSTEELFAQARNTVQSSPDSTTPVMTTVPQQMLLAYETSNENGILETKAADDGFVPIDLLTDSQVMVDKEFSEFFASLEDFDFSRLAAEIVPPG